MAAKRSLLQRTLVIALAAVVILAGLLVGAVRLIDHFAPQYRQAIAQRLGDRIDAGISIDAVNLRWSWHGPLLYLSDVRVTRHGETRPALTLDGLGLQFAFMDLLQGQYRPVSLVIDRPRLALRLGSDSRPRVEHWSRPGDAPLGWDQIESMRGRLRSLRIADARLRLIAPSLPDGQAVIDTFDATVQNAGGALDLTFEAGGPAWFRHAAGRARLTGTLPDIADADFDFKANDIDPLALAKAARKLDPDLAKRLTGAHLSATLQGRWQDHQLARSRTRLTLSALADERRPKPVLPELTATVQAQAGDTPGHIDFSLARMEGALDGLATLALNGTFDTREPAIRIDARHVPGKAAVSLVKLRFAELAGIDIQTGIDNFRLRVGAQTPLGFGLDFVDFRIDDPELTVGPVNGTYEHQNQTRVLQLNETGGHVTVQRYLRGTLPIGDLTGELAWRPSDDGGWQIDVRRLDLASGNADVTAHGSVRLPTHGAPVVDLNAKASAPEAARLLAHVPQAPDLPNERLRDWLPKAIKAGTLESGRLEIAGPLDRFPFAEPRAGERFLLTLQGHGVDVDYKPPWPTLQDARGTLVLDGDDLQVDIAAATMLDVAIGASTGKVANVREPVLEIDGQVNRGPAGKMLAFLDKSPLQERFGQITRALALSGPADLALDLRAPLKPGLGDIEVAGLVTALGATLQQDALPGPITDIRGRLRFDQAGLHAKQLEGDLLGLALRTEITPGADGSQQIITRASLRLPADTNALAHYLPRPWIAYAKGETGLRVGLNVARDGAIADLGVDSDLTGMAIDLPAPIAKAAATAAPLHLDIAADASRVQVAYDDRLTLALRLSNGQPLRAQILLNAPDMTPPDRNGIWIGGQTEALDAPGWFHVVRDLLADEDGASAGQSTAPAFLGGDLRVARLRLDNRYFENARVRVQPLHDRPGWRIDFEGPNTQGQVTWAQPAGGRARIAGNLKRLVLKTEAPQSGTQRNDETAPVLWRDVSPLELPRLDINVAEVAIDQTDFGETHVRATAMANGWRLNRLVLENGTLTGRTSGRWLIEDGLTRAKARTHLEGRGLAELMRTLGYAPTVHAQSTEIDARLAITPNPNGLDLRALRGSVQLALDDGTLVSVEPGAGRVLGLLNLYVLPRRLRLDFRDVVDEGLAFDTIRASFRIRDGSAYSDNVQIKTPSSTIEIDGRIGLAARDYDQRVTIMPKVGSGLATVAGAVIGGPLVGAAVFAVQELLKEPIQKFSSIAYTLRGSWDDPEIAEPSAIE